MNTQQELIKSIEKSYISLCSNRTKAGMREAILNGRYLHKTFGYSFDNNSAGKRQLFPDSNAEYVKLIFILTNDGKKVREISDILKSKNIFLSLGQIARIIKNPVYCGLIKYEGNLIKAIHEPLISEDIFKKINTTQK